MLAVFFCLAGIAAILFSGELLWRRNILTGERQRKLVHAMTATFIAFWPWIISWRAIQFIGLAMIVVVLVNRKIKRLHYLGNVRIEDYGDVFLAVAVTACALLTDVKIFFALAILQVALADSVAAVVGKKFGGPWRYKVFGQPRTVLGSMAFWITSLCVFGAGIPFAHDIITLHSYAVLLIVMPPILTAIENLSLIGLDNLIIPLAVLGGLHLALS